jgi:hypothetical protein
MIAIGANVLAILVVPNGSRAKRRARIVQLTPIILA